MTRAMTSPRSRPAALAALPILLPLLISAVGCGGAPRSPIAIAHLDAGALLLADGALDRAEARFRLALEFQPDLSEARMNLGLVELARGRLTEAAAELRAALALRPDFAEAHGNLGVVLEAMGEVAHARAAYETALAIHPGLVFARRNLSRLLVQEGELGAARAHLFRLLEEREDDAEGHALLAWVELRLERPEAARDRLRAAFLTEPAPPVAHLVRAVLAMREGELDSALTDLESAANDAALAHEVAVRRAMIELLSGEAAEALGLATELVDEDPFDAPARLVAAVAALALGRFAEARDHAEAALEVEPALTAARDARDAALSALAGR